MLFNLIVGNWELRYFARLTGKTKHFAEIMEIILAKGETIAMHFHLFASIYVFPHQIPANTGMYFAHKAVIMHKIKVASPALQWWLVKKYTKYTSIPGSPVSPKHHPKAGYRLSALSPLWEILHYEYCSRVTGELPSHNSFVLSAPQNI